MMSLHSSLVGETFTALDIIKLSLFMQIIDTAEGKITP